MIVVTGATGHCGGATARHLLDAGARVRALTRDAGSDGARRIEAHGAELFEGDMLEPASLEGLFDGVDRAFLVTSPEAGFDAEVAAGCGFVDVAARAGLEHLLFLSVLYAETAMPHCATKGRVEQHLVASGIPHTILRAGYFLQQLGDGYFAPEAVAAGTILSVIDPDVPVSFIAVEDVGAASARVLLEARPEGRVIGLGSPEVTTFRAITELYASLSGRELHCVHRPMSTRELLEGLVAAGVLEADKAEAHLAATPDPDADYHAPVNSGRWVADPTPLLELGCTFAGPLDFVRGLAIDAVAPAR